ncbi:MAG: YdbL family protein [Nitrospira sp.]
MISRRFVLNLVKRAAGAGAFLIMLLAVVSPASAVAASLDEAKTAGYLGERPDGYVGLVRQDVPDWARQLVNDINAQRRNTYAEVAERTPGASVREVGIIAGRKLIERAPAGHHVMNEQGQWVVKR